MPVLNEILRTLYASPSILTAIPIQDLFGWCARINRPGTVSDSNWSYRLPIPLERMTTSHAIQSRARDLKEIATQTKRFDPVKPGPRRTESQKHCRLAAGAL